MADEITPFLWFDHQAEAAARYYTSIFKNSRIVSITHYEENSAKASGRPKGSVMTVAFRLGKQDFVALNGGPNFKFTEAVSFMVNCDSQAEVDYYWKKLSRGGDPSARQCGWLKDKYGLSWQIVPSALLRMLADADPEHLKRVMRALMKMKKFDIEKLERARKGQAAR